MSEEQIQEAAPTQEPLPDEIRVELGETLKHGKQELTALVLARPRVKHLRAMDKVVGENSKAVALLSAMTGLPMSVLDEMGIDDFAEVTTQGEPFFAKLEALSKKR